MCVHIHIYVCVHTNFTKSIYTHTNTHIQIHTYIHFSLFECMCGKNTFFTCEICILNIEKSHCKLILFGYNHDNNLILNYYIRLFNLKNKSQF